MVLHQHPPHAPPLKPPSRKNRRRERPGARKRHALHNEVSEGITLASDPSIYLPYETHRPGLRQLQHQHQAYSYERNWKAWKAREQEQAAERERRAERQRQRQREEYDRLFGVGSRSGEDEGLCESMLGVVYSLWGGIDYVDP